MKFSVGIPTTLSIPNHELHGLARRARARGVTLYWRGVQVEDIIEQARLEGLLDIPEDFIRHGDDDRIFIRGKITTPYAEIKRQKRLKRQRSKRK